LRSTQLPLPAAAAGGLLPQPKHDAAYWAERTQSFDFTSEDKLDSDSFNQVLWSGLKGETEPYPAERDGRDLRKRRTTLLRNFNQRKQQ